MPTINVKSWMYFPIYRRSDTPSMHRPKVPIARRPQVPMDQRPTVMVRVGVTGADPGFSFRGGAQKIMCPPAHYERKTELTFGRGPGPA